MCDPLEKRVTEALFLDFLKMLVFALTHFCYGVHFYSFIYHDS